MKELPAGKMAHVLSSPLWKPVFRHGLIESPHVHTDEVWCTSTESVFIFVYTSHSIAECQCINAGHIILLEPQNEIEKYLIVYVLLLHFLIFSLAL